jgi:hypothetical protein
MASEDSILKLYLSIGDAERQLNTIQNQYRLLASTWMIASLGGIGFVLKSSASDGWAVDLEKTFVCCLIALSGAVSILMLWLVDIGVYQRLLSQYFNEGMAMEQGEPWLPQMRNQTRREFKGKLSRIISFYYIGLFVFLSAVACIFMAKSSTTVMFGIQPAGWVRVILAVNAILILWILWSVRPTRVVGPSKKKIEDPLSVDDRTEDYQKRAERRLLRHSQK